MLSLNHLDNWTKIWSGEIVCWHHSNAFGQNAQLNDAQKLRVRLIILMVQQTFRQMGRI